MLVSPNRLVARSLVSHSNSKLPLLLFLLTAVGLLVAACGGDEPVGDCLRAEGGTFVDAACEAPGATLEPTATPPPSEGGGVAVGSSAGFTTFRGAGCAACHTIDGTAAAGTIGPNLTTVSAKGVEYIRQSIVTPSAVVVEGFPDNVMPQTFGTTLTPEEIDTIVAYLGGL
jgi:mono/diheme cytochrome c family protein